jgi:hypothetical protein
LVVKDNPLGLLHIVVVILVVVILVVVILRLGFHQEENSRSDTDEQHGE